MRTTVDIEPDLLVRLRLMAVRRRVSFKRLLNDAIRSALTTHRSTASTPYTMPSFHMGAVREGVNLDKALALSCACCCPTPEPMGTSRPMHISQHWRSSMGVSSVPPTPNLPDSRG